MRTRRSRDISIPEDELVRLCDECGHPNAVHTGGGPPRTSNWDVLYDPYWSTASGLCTQPVTNPQTLATAPCGCAFRTPLSHGKRP